MKRRYDLLREASEMKRDETFQKYRAAKVKGRPHPDPIIESMALAAVPVPDVTLDFHFSKRLIGTLYSILYSLFQKKIVFESYFSENSKNFLIFAKKL